MTSNPDHSIDTVLTGLRNVTSPTNLEARIHARLAQAEACEPKRLRFTAVILSIAKDPRILLGSPIRLASAAAAIACAAIVLIISFTLRQQHSVATHFTPAAYTAVQPAPTTVKAQVPPGLSLGSHLTSQNAQGTSAPATSPNDPDAIALAETLAPSHPAPPLPLTAQETLLLRSTRQGQPIEIAELETRRESILNAVAQARERAAVREYVHGLLGPLAAAEQITPLPTPADDSKPATDIEPPSK